jgi:hypothetical protein
MVLFSNADSYQKGKIKQTALETFNISASGDLMTLTYWDGNAPVTNPSWMEPFASLTQQPSSLLTKSPDPSAAPSSHLRFPTASPSLTPLALPYNDDNDDNFDADLCL